VAAARRELAILADRHPNTKAAERGQQLDALIEANREMDYKPLLVFFAALSARERGEHGLALRRLDEVVRSYPQAQLAPEALLMRAQVLESDGKLDDAIAAYGDACARYPTSPVLPRALLGQAAATETRDGAKPHVVGLYGQILQRYPNTPYAAQAQERLAAIRRGADRIERRFAAAGILPYRAAQIGYSDEGDMLEVQIDLLQEGTEAQVKATLEDALIKFAGQRRAGEHAVKIVARFLQTRKKAGNVKWSRDRQPDYDIERIRTRDKHRGGLDEVLK
jgi:tetratricopeptide (TPR) repeat protein